MTPLAKRLSLALVVSVGVNLLLAGYVLGYGLRRPLTAIGALSTGIGPAMGMGRGRGHGPGMGMGQAMGNSTGCRRPALRAALNLREDDIQAYRQEIMKGREDVRVVLEHEPFDRVALEQSLATLRSQSERGQELTHQAIVDAATRATPQQRRELANEFVAVNR